MPPNPTPETPTAKAPNASAPWPMILVTVLVGIFAIVLTYVALLPPAPQADNRLHLLSKGFPVLLKTTNSMERETLDFILNSGNDITDPRIAPYAQRPMGLTALSRAYAQMLPENARIFLSGMVGKENTSRGGYYFFLRNYLFPRELEISLGKPATYVSDDTAWMDGIDCTDPEVLRTNGFDLFLRFSSDNNITPIPLTAKGAGQ